MDYDVCVIGAGSAGLPALRELCERGLTVRAFELGSRVGGNWRYENDNGLSAAYASLRCNVSRRRMQYPSMPMPRSYGTFVGHADMASYLEDYALAHDLERRIVFRTRVVRVDRRDGAWVLETDDGERHSSRAVVVANGHDWNPAWPEWRDALDPTVEVLHAHDYRLPGPFAGRNVLVVGVGQSGCEIATELSAHASHLTLAVRTGTHIVPRWLLGAPFDHFDRARVNRAPWPVVRAAMLSLMRTSRTWTGGLPTPPHRILEQVPVVSSELGPAIRSGAVDVRAGVTAVDHERVTFADGSSGRFDAVIFATGYTLSYPFLRPGTVYAEGNRARLYRRIAAPAAPGLFFVGLVDAPSGKLPIFEHQAAWVADVVDGTLRLPNAATMQRSAGVPEPRTRRRFPLEPPDSIRCDAYAYQRVLARDRRHADRRSARVPALDAMRRGVERPLQRIIQPSAG